MGIQEIFLATIIGGGTVIVGSLTLIGGLVAVGMGGLWAVGKVMEAIAKRTKSSKNKGAGNTHDNKADFVASQAAEVDIRNSAGETPLAAAVKNAEQPSKTSIMDLLRSGGDEPDKTQQDELNADEPQRAAPAP